MSQELWNYLSFVLSCYPYSQSVSKLFSPFDIVFHICPSVHFYYYEEFFSLPGFNFFTSKASLLD